MKIARKYSDYLVYQLLESVMVTSKEFKSIIHDMPNNNKIADILYAIIDDKMDIKTNFNLIDVSPDQNDEVSFLPDNQYQRFITKGEDVTTKKKSNGKIGRMVGQILRDNGHTQFKDTDIEKFINSFKTAWNKKHGITNRKTQLVKGQDIKKWYNESTHSSSGGTLGNSCMRYDRVNHFMNIYAENPDKVSMVILTEDDKLLGRALFWNLDYSSQSKKYYLDRIYTVQDSDVQFIYDWVVENLVGKDVKILSSYKDSGNDYEMTVNLSKTNFDHYPYADSFNYLYEKIDEGKIVGNGYLSNWNRYDEVDVIKDYVVSEIRSHNTGISSILSHRYSEHFDIYIQVGEAANTSKGWLPKSMCKKCKYTGDWLLEEEAIYSETMQDWIQKDSAYESEKFGWVLSDAIVKVATKYIGEYTEPIQIFTAMEKGESLFEVEEQLNNSEEYFYPEYRPGRIKYYSNDLKVKDFWNESQISVTCYQVYRSIKGMEQGDSLFGPYNFVARERSSYVYLFKEDAELFDVEIDLENPTWMSSNDIRIQYKSMQYLQFVDFVNDSDLSDDKKSKIIQLKTRLHESLMDSDSTYKRNFEVYTKLKDISKLDLFNRVINEIFGRMIKNDKNQIVRAIRNRFEDSYDIELNEEEMELIIKLLRSYLVSYMTLTDSQDARSQLYYWIRNKEVGISNLQLTSDSDDRKTSIVCDLITRIFLYDGVDDIFLKYRDQVLQEIGEEYNIGSSSVYKYIRGGIPMDDINPYK